MNKFKIIIVFNLIKDKTFNNSQSRERYILHNYKTTLPETYYINSLVVNYQIKKYGSTLSNY